MTREELTKVWPVMSVAEIAETFGVTGQTVYSRARAYGLRARNAGAGGDGPDVDDPTPEQIKERSEAIKSSWTDEQRAHRCVDKRRVGYTLQCYSSSAMFGQTEAAAYSRI